MPTSQISEVIQHLRRAVLLPDGAGLTDGQLLEDYISHRNEAALAALVGRHGPMVWGVCRRVLRNYHDAEDAFQATFLVLVRKATSIHSSASVGSWLYGVAHQTALKARATTAKRATRERQVTAMPEPAVVEQDLWRDLEPLLDEELSRLPEKYRAVIVLCDLEGKTRKYVAQQLGCPEGTVAGRLARARTMLAKRLIQRGVTVSGGMLAAVVSQKVASAGVPSSVAYPTIKAAGVLLARTAATGAISVNVAALTEGAIKAMLLTKLKSVTMVTVVLVVTVGIGAGLLGYGTAAGQQGEGKKADTGAHQKEVAKSDKDQLLGKWLVISCKCNGEYRREEPWSKDALLVIEEADGKLVCKTVFKDRAKVIEVFGQGMEKWTEATLKLDAHTKPKTLDFTGVHGNGTYLGIYQLDSDTLTLCQSNKPLTPAASESGSERPTDFSTKRGDGRILTVYKRQKEEKNEEKKKPTAEIPVTPQKHVAEADKNEQSKKDARRIVATVNGESILEEDVYAASYLALPEAHHLAAAERSRRITAAWGGTLERVIERELVLQDAFRVLGGQNAKLLERLQETAAREFSQRWVIKTKRGAGLNDDQELSAFLRAQGTSLDAICRRWQRDFMAEECLRNRVHRERGDGLSPDGQVAKQERERTIHQLKQRAVVEYSTGR
jgi:RNA polymerase sigma factor (sigma-70 family)